MKRILLILAILAIAGCAATAKTEVKKGKKGLHINCSGLSSSWDNCYSKAASSCSTRSSQVVLPVPEQAAATETTGSRRDRLSCLPCASRSSAGVLTLKKPMRQAEKST